MASFGSRLRELRSKNNMKQEDLAKKFKISKSAIGMYERDEREPSFELVQKFADYFEVTTDYLLKGINHIEPTPNIAFIHGGNELTPDEIEHLEEELKRYRELKARFLKEKDKEGK